MPRAQLFSTGVMLIQRVGVVMTLLLMGSAFSAAALSADIDAQSVYVDRGGDATFTLENVTQNGRSPLSKNMQPLDDESMADISGRSGIQLTLRLRNNVSEVGTPIGCSGTPNPCRLGLEFADRGGIWLMLKDYYGSFSINDIRLEGTTLPAIYSGYQDGSRFLANDQSTCLIAGCDPRGQQALNIFYPGNKAPGVYNDLTFFVNVGRVALEFDDGATSGYLRDAATGSVLGFRAADSSALNAPNRARIEGNAYVYGF